MGDVPVPSWRVVAEAVQSALTALGILAGGVWALYRFGLRRERETALEIDLTYAPTPYDGDKYLVHFDVTLANKGSVRVAARKAEKPIYPRDQTPEHGSEPDTLNYSADLLVRRIPPGIPVGAPLRWWSDANATSPQPGDIEADLLDEFEAAGKTDFWMEPGESQHGFAAIVLEAGTYLAMVTFIGASSDEEFWRRVFVVTVPRTATET